MQIEPAGGYPPPGPTDGAPAVSKPGPQIGDLKRVTREDGEPPPADVTALVDQAAKSPEIREDAVAEARRLLESGELDSPEAIERAAKSILGLGI